MTLDQQLRQASDEIHEAVAGRRGHPLTAVISHRRVSRFAVVATAAAATLVTIGLSTAVLRSEPAELPFGAGEAVSTTVVVDPAPPTTVAETPVPTTEPIVAVAQSEDLPRFNIGLDDWFVVSATGVEMRFSTHFEIADAPPLAHMADIEVWSNNSGPTPFTSYGEHLATAAAEGQSLGTVTLDDGVTAEAFYFPNPGLYHDFMWQHSDSIWVVARIHTSTFGEEHRTEAFDEAKRIAGSIESVSEETWTELIAASPLGYAKIEHTDEPSDPSEPPVMPGIRGTPETTAWHDWVTDAMNTIGFEIDRIDVVELEGKNSGRIAANVWNPDGDNWLLGFGPWLPGEYSDEPTGTWEYYELDEQPGRETPEGWLIVGDMRPNSIVVHLWMGEDEGHITLLAERGDDSSAPPLDPELLEALVRTAAPTVKQLLGTDPGERIDYLSGFDVGGQG